MTNHFHRELDDLRGKLIQQSEEIREAIENAIQAFLNQDKELANEVIESDRRMDEREVEIEEECLKLLALYQPVAEDLRFLISTIKINNDLERIGDLSQNICERAIYLVDSAKGEGLDLRKYFEEMTKRVQNLVRESLNALLEKDVELARTVRSEDDKVDDLHREMFEKLTTRIQEEPEIADFAINSLSVSRYLERIGDHASNIGEDVVYMMEGEIVRHRDPF